MLESDRNRTNDVVGPNLAAFVRKFKATFNKQSTHRTKVAVIDSGVVIVGGKGKGQEQDKGEFSKDCQRLPYCGMR